MCSSLDQTTYSCLNLFIPFNVFANLKCTFCDTYSLLIILILLPNLLETDTSQFEVPFFIRLKLNSLFFSTICCLQQYYHCHYYDYHLLAYHTILYKLIYFSSDQYKNCLQKLGTSGYGNK